MRNVLRILMGVFLCHSVAWAQTMTAAQTMSSSSTSTTATKKPANTGEIYRWVDKNGKVQYGTDVPETYREKARKVDTRSNIVSSQVPARILTPTPQPSANANTSPTTRQPVTEREKCEAAWQRYNESAACFAQNRQGINARKTGTGISAEAQAKCQNIAEPAPCR